MKNILSACLLSLCFCFNAIAGDNKDLLRAADEFIIPESIHLEQAMIILAERADAYCEAPGPEGLTALREGFHYGMNAWQSAQVIRFGPIQYALRIHRFQMWPDKRSTVSKHLSRLLASHDMEQLKPDNFAHSSVAIQGLSALERLLFNDKPIESYDCAVIEAIAHNMADMSSRLVHDWITGEDPHREFIASSPNGNAIYESDAEVRSNLLNDLHTELQLIADQKLQQPLGEDIHKAHPKRSESWRSQRSLKNIGLNLKAVESLYRVTFAPQLKDKALAAQVDKAFADCFTALQAIPSPLYQAVQDDAQRKTVETLLSKVMTLEHLFGNNLPQALDVSLGFNSLDGD